ncbi:MAG: hypothetical protein GY830_00195 [Bacteroidetes bacterium]|nr:hypothetical protein [Bacteroidota bacterium]
MVFDENWFKIYGSKYSLNPSRTIEGATLGHNDLKKTHKIAKKISLLISQKLEKSLMVSPWFLMKIGPKYMVPNILLIHPGLCRVQH